MKSIACLFLSIVFFSSLLLAGHRGVFERLSGEAFLPNSQAITLDEPVLNIDGQEVSSLILTTPNRPKNSNRLKLESKRSIVLLDKNSIKELEPELNKSILSVVNNDAQKLDVRYKKTGLDNFYVFGNFEASRKIGDTSEWFIAIIPKTAQVEDLILQIEWFGAGAGAHTQLRMTLDYPIVAIPQAADTYSPFVFENGYSKGDLIYSLQAARVEGGEQDWGPLKGVMGEFGNALQIFDTRTLALDQITRSVVKEYRLNNLTKEQKNKIFVSALTESDSKEELGIYNTVFASCVTYSLKALKAGIPQIKTTWFNPYSILQNVGRAHAKGIDYIGTLNDEFGPILDNNNIMTMQKIQQTKSHQMSRKLQPLLGNPKFDEIIQKIALFFIDEGLTYQEVKDFIEKVNKAGHVTKAMATTEGSQKFLEKISALWRDDFNNKPLADFFRGMRALQTQTPSTKAE